MDFSGFSIYIVNLWDLVKKYLENCINTVWVHDALFIKFCEYLIELCPFFDLRIVKRWNLANKISGELLELVSCYLAHRLCPRYR